MENEENVQEIIELEDESVPHTAYLTRFDSLRDLIELRCEYLANDWNTDDLAALYSLMRSIPPTEEGFATIADKFQDTTVEEIKDVVDTLKDLIIESETNRFQHKKFKVKRDDPPPIPLSDSEFEATRRLTDFVLNLANKKKIRESMQERLKDTFKMFANETPTTKKVGYFSHFLIYLISVTCFIGSIQSSRGV